MWASSTLRTEDVKSIGQSAKQWKANALDRPWRQWELKGVSSLSEPFWSSDRLNPQDRRAGPSASSASHWRWHSAPLWAQIPPRQRSKPTGDRLHLMTVKQSLSQSKNLSLHIEIKRNKGLDMDRILLCSTRGGGRPQVVGFWSCYPQIFTVGSTITAGADTKQATNFLCLVKFRQQCSEHKQEHDQSKKGTLSAA